MSSIIIMTICHLYNQKQSNVGFLFESRYMSSHELQISSKLFMCNSITHCFWSVVYCKVGFCHRRVFFSISYFFFQIHSLWKLPKVSRAPEVARASLWPKAFKGQPSVLLNNSKVNQIETRANLHFVYAPRPPPTTVWEGTKTLIN